MAINRFEISLLSTFKAYPATATPGVHFDDDWFCNQIKEWQRRVPYYQKVQRTDTPRVQVLSTLAPVKFRLYKIDGSYDGSTAVDLDLITFDAINAIGVYDKVLDFTDTPDGIYYPVFEASFLTLTFRCICEPISLKAKHKNTTQFRFKNSLNDFGVVFSAINDTTLEPYKPDFTFRCEAAIMKFNPDRDRASFRDQVLNTKTTYATPSRNFKLLVADAPGVAPWVVDLLNRIICCDYWENENKQFETPEGAKWELKEADGYPLVGAAIDVVEAKNLSSIQLTSDEVPAGGIVVAYEIETDAFGTPTAPASTNPVNIESVEE